MQNSIKSIELTESKSSNSGGLNFLRSQWTALTGIILILLATLKHSYEVYEVVMGTPQDVWSKVYVILMLLAIDFAVILFTLHGNRGAAGLFAFFIFVLNLFAFWNRLEVPGWDFMNWIPFIPGLIYSGMFAYGLYYFTDIFVNQIEEDAEKTALLNDRNTLLSENKELRQTLQKREDNSEMVNKLEQDRKRTQLRLQMQQNEYEQQVEQQKQKINQLRSALQAAEENYSDDMASKAKNFDILISYILEKEKYSDKSADALRKGVAYWQERLDQKGEEATLADWVKFISYQEAYSKSNGQVPAQAEL